MGDSQQKVKVNKNACYRGGKNESKMSKTMNDEHWGREM